MLQDVTKEMSRKGRTAADGRTEMSTINTVVIIGAGLGGASAAQTLRDEGFDGRIVLVGEESELPYDRPPLSKGYLAGETPRTQVHLHDREFYTRHDIELLTGTAVEELDLDSGSVQLQTGERIPFDRALLATGSEPRRLPVPGGGLAGVHYLRTLADADRLSEDLKPGARLVVVGAGWIGMEIAATARERGAEVTVVEPTPVPLGRVLGPEVGGIYRNLHEEHGVLFRMGSGIEAFEGSSRVERVLTSEGERIEADTVVVGIGVQPRTRLAELAGLPVENGILVDELLRSSDPRIHAAGDVANTAHALYGERVRVEHWANARNQGEAAARSMLGKGRPYDTLPFFYTDQYDTGMEYRGLATKWDRVVLRGEPGSGEFLAFWLQGDRVLAGMNFNIWDAGDDIETLLRSRAEVDPGRLADPNVALNEVASNRERKEKERPGPLAFMKHFVQDRLATPDRTPLEALAPGEGKVLEVHGERVAAYRDPDGKLHGVSPVCTHARCLVQWEKEETAWGCPCHGSRFSPAGEVLRGPAKKPLAAKEL